MPGLAAYRAKRDFSRTPEPADAGTASRLGLRYSMQNHRARRLHWDLRLEWDGVLLSWAVTRGPSFDPSEKRLAVRTEDHPLGYLDFEGEIPAGSYGAGTVMLWDIGWWQPLEPPGRGLAKGHLKFRLHGERLTGDWHLVRLKGKGEKRENWLLIKSEDEAAGQRDPVRRYRRSVATGRSFAEIAKDAAPVVAERTGRRPKPAEPQLALLVEGVADPDRYWHELKFDGYRVMAAVGKGGTRLHTRNGHDWTERFPGLARPFDALPCEAALIDGEVVAGAGLQGFGALQEAIAAGGPFRYIAFDLLSLDGRDLRDQPLAKRRTALERLFRQVPPLGPLELSPVVEGPAEGILDTVCRGGGEGLIAKPKDGRYRAGRGGWLKIKCRRRAEFVIVGWQPSTSRARPFASLALAARDGGVLRYVGKVGTGFDTAAMETIATALKPLARKTAPAEAPKAETAGMRWVAPRLVAEVDYAEMTGQGRLRHAVFLGLREDKPARAVELERTTPMTDTDTTVAGIRISSPDRVVFPEAGLTKAGLARYYEAIAPAMLEEAADRPLSLVRLPEGLEGERFFQKHPGKGFPDELRIVEIEESDGARAPYGYVADAAGLVAAVQMGTIEFHLWGARRDRLDRPDRLVFDLDPDEGLGFAEVRSAARDLRDRLAGLGLETWAMVTGGKGVHIVVPLRRTVGWETAKLFTRGVAAMMAQAEPGRFTADLSKARRKGRIFIDYLRNERGATAVAPFSVRARSGAPVAVPVTWDELDALRSAAAFGTDAAAERGWNAVRRPPLQSLTARTVAALEEASSA